MKYQIQKYSLKYNLIRYLSMSSISGIPGISIPIIEIPKNLHNVQHIAIDPKNCTSCYYLTISSITPRPIALVSSQSAKGIKNVAPFSYFTTVAHDPPTITFGICTNRDGTLKDTLNNIIETKQFCVNMISEWIMNSANYCSGNFPSDIDEGEVVGFTYLPCNIIRPCRIKESAVNLECELMDIKEIRNDKGNITTHVVFGRIVQFHILDDILTSSEQRGYEVDFSKFKSVGRLGGDIWCKVGDTIDLPRPKV